MKFSKSGTPEKMAVEGHALAEHKATLLACVTGGVASIGGFIFGYIRYALQNLDCEAQTVICRGCIVARWRLANYDQSPVVKSLGSS
jgi:hypothetical protein